MAEKPIIFSGPMVKAILEGRKTQTRRVLCPHIEEFEPPYIAPYEEGARAVWCDTDGGSVRGFTGAAGAAVGDLLWVCETWANAAKGIFPGGIVYRADNPELANSPAVGKWKSSIHMLKHNARIWLRVTDVRVERVQDIGEGDAKAEGCRAYGPGLCTENPDDYMNCYSARTEFQDLWNALNEKRGFGWDANPWVVVIEFERCEAP